LLRSGAFTKNEGFWLTVRKKHMGPKQNGDNSMFKNVKTAFFGLGLLTAALMGASDEAKAYGNDYCREYTRTVYIGNRMQEAYGKACLQPDGSWMIVGEGMGNDIPANVSNVDYVIRDNDRYITPPRVVYYSQPRVNVYRSAPAFVWYHNGHYRDGHYVSYKKHKHWDRHDRWDRRDRHRHGHDDHRGRGRRGHDRD
jgi:hypothetical protein